MNKNPINKHKGMHLIIIGGILFIVLQIIFFSVTNATSNQKLLFIGNVIAVALMLFGVLENRDQYYERYHRSREYTNMSEKEIEAFLK